MAARGGTGPGRRAPAAGLELGTVCGALFLCHGSLGAFSARLVMGEVRELCFAFLAFHTEITIKAVISRKMKDQLESKYEFDKKRCLLS